MFLMFVCFDFIYASKKKVKLKTSEQNEAHRLLKHILIILEIVDCAFFLNLQNSRFSRNYGCLHVGKKTNGCVGGVLSGVDYTFSTA
jgi:hypothetical protein